MKIILCGINAKYIHSNLAIYSLKNYARKVEGVKAEILIKEYTINHYVDQILQDLYLEKADIIAFSSYIWNIHYVKELARELKKVASPISIWVGGPEVSYNADRFLEENPSVDLVMQGEGEKVFSMLVEALEPGNRTLEPGNRTLEQGKENLPYEKMNKIQGMEITFSHIQGIAYRKADGTIANQGFAPLMDMNELPFVYEDFDLFRNKILYYETSRGCPFRCSYCLSSVDKTVRLRSLDIIYQELDAFLQAGVPQVKFIDRTFNCNKDHAMAIWTYIKDHDNGVTNFHFEISSDLLKEEELALFASMRPGLIQLEIGVQSTNPPTIDAIHRHMELDKLWANVDRVHDMGNIHQHLDLIIGLPYEDYNRFARSFDDMYAHAPDQLQMGFLKVLKGTRMEEEADGYDMAFRDQAPYEIMKTRWLSYDEIIRLKGIEAMVEMYYNSMQYTYTLRYVMKDQKSAFHFFERLAEYYHANEYHKQNQNRMQKYEILRAFLLNQVGNLPYLSDVMRYDLYLREHAKARPAWAPDLSPYKKIWKEMYRMHTDQWFPDAGIDSKTAANLSHIEPFAIDMEAFVRRGEIIEDSCWMLFDYTKRNPLNKDARTLRVGP